MAGPDRFRNRQTVLFYEKRNLIGPKNGIYIYLTELNFVRPLSFEIFFLFGPKIHKFASSVKLFIVSN